MRKYSMTNWRKEAQKDWDRGRDDISKQEYKMQSLAQKEVAKAMEKAWNQLYKRSDTREEEKDLLIDQTERQSWARCGACENDKGSRWKCVDK